YCHRSPRNVPSFPTRRSSDLDPLVPESHPRPLRESHPSLLGAVRPDHSPIVSRLVGSVLQAILAALLHALPSGALGFQNYADRLDRKSTRLNSSHVAISYAVR